MDLKALEALPLRGCGCRGHRYTTLTGRFAIPVLFFLQGVLTPRLEYVGREAMAGHWEAYATAEMKRRLGASPAELGNTDRLGKCPDIWELDNGDIAVIGSDLTDSYAPRLPEGVAIAENERLVVIPRSTIISAKSDIPDA
ncbi:hypothetical protein GCM10028793_02590 [Nocardiopsis oceani]